MAGLDNDTAAVGFDPSLGKSPSTAGFGSKISTTFTGVNQAVTGLVANLTKAASLTSQIRRDTADIAKNMKAAGGSHIGSGIFNNGNVGSGSSMNLGLSAMSSVSSSGALASRLGKSDIGMGTFGGSKFFAGLSGVGGVLGGLGQMALSPAVAAFAMLPGTSDVLARNRYAFSAGLGSSMGANAVAGAATRATRGFNVNALDSVQGAAVLGSYGYSMGSSVGTNMLTSAGSLSFLTGNSIGSVANTLGANMTDPTMGNRLRMYGISTVTKNGDPRGVQSLVDQIWSKMGLGSMGPEKISRNLRPGMPLFVNLSYMVPDDDMRQLVIAGLLAKAKNGGKSINFSSSSSLGQISSNGVSDGVLGADASLRNLASVDASGLQTYSGAMSGGIKAGVDQMAAVQGVVNNMTGLVQPLASTKGYLEAIAGTKQGEGLLAGVVTGLHGLQDALGGVTTLLGILGGVGGGAAGGGLLAKLMGKGGGGAAAAAGGGAARTALGVAGRTLGGVGVGVGLDMGVDALSDATKSSVPGWVNKLGLVAGKAGAGAAGGALIGSVLPGPGTAIGAVIGTAAGLGLGLRDAFSADATASTDIKMQLASNSTPTTAASAGNGTSDGDRNSTNAANMYVGKGSMSKDALANTLRQAGFSGKSLQIAYSIAMAESTGNPNAHNPNPPDNSYGLFQINMIGASGPQRRKMYGLSSNEQLYNPATNAHIAYLMSGGGKHWGDWSTYTHGSYKNYMANAPAYSQGAWNISSDQAANLHSGEMVLPASIARTVRQELQAGMTQSSAKANMGNVMINVHLSNATDATAMRFAKSVQSALSGETALASLGSS